MFSVSGEEPVDVLNSLDFRSIAIQKFDHFEASPDSIAIADTQEFAVRKDIPDRSWRRISAVSPIDITGQDPGLLPSIAIESSRQEIESAGTLDRVWVRPGTEVTLEKTNTQMPALSLKLDGQPAIAVLSFPNSFNLFGDHASIGGISDRLLGGESFALRIHLPSSRPEAEVTGKGPLLALFLNLPTREHPRVFSRNGIPVTAIDFTQQGPQGNVESSLIGTGEIVFPDYPKMQRIEIPARQFVVLQNILRIMILAF